tara:strand:- start:253 stop:642 length:390 start_codon:yes stop_codon:yes gene_type:complete
VGKIRRDYKNIHPSSPISSRGIKSGNMLFISGTTANNSSAEDGNPMQQLRVVLDRITKMVVSEGGDPSDIVRLTTFVTKIDDWFPLEGEIVDIFTEFFGDQKPTNAIMEVSRLAMPPLVVEIEATVIFD